METSWSTYLDHGITDVVGLADCKPSSSVEGRDTYQATDLNLALAGSRGQSRNSFGLFDRLGRLLDSANRSNGRSGLRRLDTASPTTGLAPVGLDNIVERLIKLSRHLDRPR